MSNPFAQFFFEFKEGPVWAKMKARANEIVQQEKDRFFDMDDEELPDRDQKIRVKAMIEFWDKMEMFILNNVGKK